MSSKAKIGHVTHVRGWMSETSGGLDEQVDGEWHMWKWRIPIHENV